MLMIADTMMTTNRELAGKLIQFLETGDAPGSLFADEAFCDFTMPLGGSGSSESEIVALRRAGHPSPGRVPRCRLDDTSTGFVLEVEEEWDQDGETRYCRELFRADVADGAISQLSVYCTGDGTGSNALVSGGRDLAAALIPIPLFVSLRCGVDERIGSGGRPSAAQVAELVERLSTARNGGEAVAAQAA